MIATHTYIYSLGEFGSCDGGGMRIGPHFTTVTWGLKSKHRKVLLVRCFLVFLLIFFFRNTGQYCCVTHKFCMIKSQIIKVRQLIHLFCKWFLEKKSTFCSSSVVFFSTKVCFFFFHIQKCAFSLQFQLWYENQKMSLTSSFQAAAPADFTSRSQRQRS